MRAKVEQVVCDFCGYGSPWSEPRDFVDVAGVDLCRWCASAPTQPGALSSGRHEVAITESTWTCTCGERYRTPLAPQRVLAALPSLVGATAVVHTNQI